MACARPPLRLPLLLLLLAAPPLVRSDYFPVIGGRDSWQGPLLQPWDPLRATHVNVLVAWTPAWNPWCAVDRYELEVRRPDGHPLLLADLEGLQHRELDQEDPNWPGDAAWTPWNVTYVGAGRSYMYWIPLGTAHAVQFRVRACGAKEVQDACSEWSNVQTCHTILSAAQDRVNFYVRGTGKNAPGYTIIEVNREIIYRRRDETGLVLAVFSRLDFSLQWLQTYDTHRDRTRSLDLARDIRQFNQSYFVVMASTIAWEWQATRSLAKTMEFCGAFHFGQWAYTFAEHDHYSSPRSDLQQTGAQDEFGHPYAFIGIPGIGTAMGWESLEYNSGHYLAPNLRTHKAIIRGVAYYDYVARIYRLQDVVATKADYYRKATPPAWETLHNPVPRNKYVSTHKIATMTPLYTPYIGTLQEHVTKLIEANETVPPHNFAFVLVTDAKVRKVDPRPREYWITELERVWKGPSRRYWEHNGTLLNPGTERSERNCTDLIYYNYTQASPELCGNNFEDCCPQVDLYDVVATTCNIGVTPTLCRSAEVQQLTNRSILMNATIDKWPYEFHVIDYIS